MGRALWDSGIAQWYSTVWDSGIGIASLYEDDTLAE